MALVDKNKPRKPINVVRGEYGRRLVVYLSEEQWAALSTRAARRERPVGELVRELLCESGVIPGTHLVPRGALAHRE